MKKKLEWLVLGILVVGAILSVLGYASAVQLGLGVRAEASSQQVEKDLEALFSHQQADRRLGQIRSALVGYNDLVDIINQKSNLAADYGIRVIRQNIPEETQIVIRIQGKDLSGCSSVGWADQNIGFSNWMHYVEGYIEFQEYQNMKLRLELMKMDGSPSSAANRLAEQLKETKSKLANSYIGEGNWVD